MRFHYSLAALIAVAGLSSAAAQSASDPNAGHVSNPSTSQYDVEVHHLDKTTSATRASADPNESRRSGGESTSANSNDLIRGEKFIGMEVVNKQGESIGKVKDVVLDADRAKVDYAVLAYGGAMGIGEKLFSFPVSKIGIPSDKKQLVLDRDLDSLKNQEGFDKSNWPDMQVASKEQSGSSEPGRSEQAAFYKEGAKAPGDHATETKMSKAEDRGTTTARNAKFRKLSEIIGSKVDDGAGKAVGKIADVRFTREGELDSAILAVDQSGTMKDRMVEVTWKRIEWNQAKETACIRGALEDGSMKSGSDRGAMRSDRATSSTAR